MQYIEHTFQHIVRVKFINVIVAVAKSGSFGFAEGLALCRGKTKCATCAAGENCF